MRISRRDFVHIVARFGASYQAGKSLNGQQARVASGQQILDIHQHANYVGRSIEQLVFHQKTLGITKTILLAGAGWMDSELGGNAICLSHCKQYPDLFRMFCDAEPNDPNCTALLADYLAKGSLGIGEMKFLLSADSPHMHRVYKLAEEKGVPVLLHFQDPRYETGFTRFHKILETYPKVNFIGHALSWWSHVSADAASNVSYPTGPVKKGGITDRLLSDYANIYADLSANSGLGALTRDDDFARDFVTRHAKKLLFGSDCPCVDTQGTGSPRFGCLARKILTRLDEIIPDPNGRRQILYENGARLLKLI